MRKITRKNRNEMGRLETETKEMEKLKIEMIECKIFYLIDDLNIEKEFEIEKIKEKEIRLEKLKMSKNNC